MAVTKEELMTEVERLVEAGDETALETYVLEHFEDLPEEAQGKMLLSYFQEAVAARAADAKITELQETALGALKALEEKKE